MRRMTVYLYIDKNGVLRSTNKRPNMPEWIYYSPGFTRIRAFKDGATYTFDYERAARFCGWDRVAWFSDIIARLTALSLDVRLIDELIERWKEHERRRLEEA
ncbi:MAG: hypothetical protein ACXQTW_07540 [Candidatus Methanospirareceae archaeon]